MMTYHAFHCGKLNQSFRMEDENNQLLYEANLMKFRLFSASDFEFINHISATSFSCKISKTNSIDDGVMGASVTSSSYFNIDGRNCFDVLEEKGCSIQLRHKLDILHPEFALVDNNGNEVAIYKMNVSGAKEENVIGIGKQSNTMILTENDDIDIVFLGAFIISRVDFSLYLI